MELDHNTDTNTNDASRSDTPSVRDRLRESIEFHREKEAGERRTETRDSLRRDFEPDSDAALRAGRAKAKRLSATENELASIQRGEAPDQDTSATPETPEPAKSAAPTAWSKEAKAVWDQLPEPAKAAILKREQDSGKGVEALKSRYKDVDDVRAKVEPRLNQLRMPFKDFVEGSAGWFMALTGPQRVQAAQHLLRNLGIDPASVAGMQPQQHQQNAAPQGFDPRIQHLAQRLDSFEQQQAAQLMSVAQQTVEQWAKDKPFFTSVKAEMARLMQSGEVPLLPNGHADLDTAYNRAIEPIMAQFAQQQQTQEQERRAAAERARKASASLRTGTAPGASYQLNGANKKTKGKSVRESLYDSIAEHRGA